MYYPLKTSGNIYNQEQYGINLVSEIKFSKNGYNRNKRYLFKFNSEKILLEEFLSKEFSIIEPKLIIWLNCELSDNYLTSNYQINNLIENIERLIIDNETWIIGAGLDVGMHKMIGKIVKRNKMIQNTDLTFLIGINTWQNIIGNENINNNSIEYKITKHSIPGRFSLNSNYEILFFMDENQHEKEISFYNHFYKAIKKYGAFSLQIVYGGDKINLEKAYNYLKNSNSLVIIKDSGGIADLIVEKMDSSDAKFNEAIGKFNFNELDLELVKDWLSDMHETYKNEIIIFDLRRRDFRLDESLYQALMTKKTSGDKQFIYSLLFNEEVINKFDFPEITNIDELKMILKKVLISKNFKLLKLLLSYIKNIDKYFTNADMEDLYQESITIDIGNCDDLYKIYHGYLKLKQNLSTNSGRQTNIELANMINEPNGDELTESFVNGKELFIWSIDSELFETARTIFEFSGEYLATALHGIVKLKSKSKVYKKKGFKQLSNKCLLESLYYENIYKEILDEIYEKNYFISLRSLIKPQKLYDDKSMLQIIIKEDVNEICNTSACERLLQNAYDGGEPSLLWEKEKNGNSSGEKRKYCSKNFILCPKFKYYTHLIFYCIFLLLFMYFNLFELNTFDIKKTRSVVIEIFIYFFIFGFILEDIQQIIIEKRKRQSSWKIYCKYNKFHIFTLLLSIFCSVMRFLLPDKCFVIVRCLFCFMLSCYILKLLNFGYYFESIGSKIVMIKLMVKDLTFFLVIFVIFILAYGTLLQSLLHPNGKIGWYSLTGIFYMPYFQFYGELMLDSFEDLEKGNTFDRKFRYSTIIVGLALFLLLTTILLLNLLIAMFNYTFQMDVKDFNSFLRLQLFQKYQFKSRFPSPLNIITLPYWIYNYKLWKDNLFEIFDEKEMKKISIVENWCAKKVLEKIHSKQN